MKIKVLQVLPSAIFWSQLGRFTTWLSEPCTHCCMPLATGKMFTAMCRSSCSAFCRGSKRDTASSSSRCRVNKWGRWADWSGNAFILSLIMWLLSWISAFKGWNEPIQKLWTQGPKNHTNRRGIPQHVLRMHLGGRRCGSASPPTLSSCFFFQAYLLRRDSPPPPETSPPPIETIEKNLIPKIKKINSQNISAPLYNSRTRRRLFSGGET